ncbi:MAG: FAD-binding protein [Deltaproteobacteria bacterium]|nr:FAD-binding protein [Deltaproteobacteria bacterium]MBW2446510.1 FAD-binding protein [Deltaproteobacteria bacterium]
MAQRPANWDLETDVVAVGSGLGSLTAAIVAHDQGKQVVVLEKAPKLGGLCAYGGGEVFSPAGRHMADIAHEDSDEAARAYFEFLAAGFNDQALTDKLLATYKTAIDYVEDKAGVAWEAVEGLHDYYYPDAPGSSTGRYLCVKLFEGKELGEWQTKTWAMSPHLPPGLTHKEMYEWGGLANVTGWNYELLGERVVADQRTFGPGMMGYFVKAAMVDRGIPAHIETPVRELVVEDGRVVGVRAEKDGQSFWVGARNGVILGIGGYDHNKKMATMYEEWHEWNSSTQPYFHGDHIVMGGEIGADIASVPPQNLAMFYGYNIPGEEHDGVPIFRSSWECGCPHALWVNQAGERFTDESFYKDYQPRVRQLDGRTQSFPNKQPYLIFDGNYREKFPLGTYGPGMDIPEELAVSAGSVRELAEKCDIDPDALERTLTEFNEGAEKGEDPRFGMGHFPWTQGLAGDPSYPNPNVGVVDKAPFYAVKLRPVGVGINSHGLRTNTDAQVMHVRGHEIPGLYAVGISAGLLDLGGGYQSGTSNMRAIAWGYVAGQHVSGA